jgi:hypothetical protein
VFDIRDRWRRVIGLYFGMSPYRRFRTADPRMAKGYSCTQIVPICARHAGRPHDWSAAHSECLFVSRGSVSLGRGALRALSFCQRFLTCGLPRGRVWPSSCGASRSFVLASLRALHLDPRRRRRQIGSDRGMASSATGTGRTRRWGGGRGRSVVARPGSGLTEEPVPGVQAGRAGDRVVPLLPSRAPPVGGSPPGISLETGEDSVADLPGCSFGRREAGPRTPDHLPPRPAAMLI